MRQLGATNVSFLGFNKLKGMQGSCSGILESVSQGTPYTDLSQGLFYGWFGPGCCYQLAGKCFMLYINQELPRHPEYLLL